MPGPLSVTVIRKRDAWLAGGGAPFSPTISSFTSTSGRMPPSSHASSALSTASFTQVSSALRGLSKPSRCRFLVKNSETEISRCRAPISTADTVAFGAAAGGLARTVAIPSLIPDGPSRTRLIPRSALERIGERAEQAAAVAAPGAAVHAGERRRPERGQPLQVLAAVARVRVVVERLPERLARPEDVRLGQRGPPVAALGEEVAAEQRAGVALPEEAALPGVGHVRGVEPRD